MSLKVFEPASHRSVAQPLLRRITSSCPSETTHNDGRGFPDQTRDFVPPNAAFSATRPPASLPTVTYKHNAACPRKPPVDRTSSTFNADEWAGGFRIEFNELDVISTLYDDKHNMLRFCRSGALEVDLYDGRVYHAGHRNYASYSGSFENDSPLNLSIVASNFIRAWQDKREKPERTKQCTYMLDAIVMKLRTGQSMTLERVNNAAGGQVHCSRPFCKYGSGSAPINTKQYYLSFVLLKKPCRVFFCIRCFELLWNGYFTQDDEPLAVSEYPTLKSMQSFETETRHENKAEAESNFENTYTQTCVHSKANSHSWNASQQDHHTTLAVSGSQTLSPGQGAGAESQQGELDLASPDSINLTTGEWNYPPTRAQHLAENIRPGDSLKELDKAALALWRTISSEQLQWNDLLRNSKHMRDQCSSDREEDWEPRFRQFKHSRDNRDKTDVQELETIAGVDSTYCYQQDLSEILSKANAKASRL